MRRIDRGNRQATSESRETEWVAASRRGDADAFGRLVDLFWSEFLAIAKRVLADHHAAQDVVQEAFLRIRHHLRRLDADEHFGAWAARIVRNVAIDRLRAMRRRALRFAEVESLAETVHEPEADATANELPAAPEHLARELEALPSRDRDILVLRYGRGLTYRAIAAEYGITVVHVKVTIHRCRARLVARVRRAAKLPVTIDPRPAGSRPP